MLSFVHVVQCCTVLYSVVQWCKVVYSGVQYCIALYSIVQLYRIVHAVVQCSVVQCAGAGAEVGPEARCSGASSALTE